MKTNSRLILFSMAVFAFTWACGGGGNKNAELQKQMEMAKQSSEAQADGSALSSEEKAQIESGKGVGEIKEVKLSDPLDEQMVKTGISVYEMKCASCHKLDDQRTVGPGWKGITNKRRPEWIMNMVTNVEVMLDEDPTAQKLLEECMTRMPNQGLAVGDARNVLEFMRKNDVEKAGSKDGALK